MYYYTIIIHSRYYFPDYFHRNGGQLQGRFPRLALVRRGPGAPPTGAPEVRAPCTGWPRRKRDRHPGSRASEGCPLRGIR